MQPCCYVNWKRTGPSATRCPVTSLPSAGILTTRISSPWLSDRVTWLSDRKWLLFLEFIWMKNGKLKGITCQRRRGWCASSRSRARRSRNDPAGCKPVWHRWISTASSGSCWPSASTTDTSPSSIWPSVGIPSKTSRSPNFNFNFNFA